MCVCSSVYIIILRVYLIQSWKLYLLEKCGVLHIEYKIEIIKVGWYLLSLKKIVYNIKYGTQTD